MLDVARRAAVTIAALGAATGASLLGPAAPASAAVCNRVNQTVSDVGSYGYERTWNQVSYCGNDYGAPVYASANAAVRIGTMLSTNSWFVCYVYGAPHAGGNSVWYYTQGDRVVSHPEYHAWGYVPAVNVHTTNDPGDSRLPAC